MATEALREFEDLTDDPHVLRLAGTLAFAAAFTREYELARTMADDTLAAAERLGMADLAARMLQVKGAIAQFHGRLWEARALTEGALKLAQEHDLSDLVNRVHSALSNILALDDPRATAAVEREITAHARRVGRRESEIVTLGNMAEDVRRTGDWDPMLAEMRGAIHGDSENVNDLVLHSGIANFRILRGEMSGDELAEMRRRLEALEDPDTSTSGLRLQADLAVNERDYSSAAALWIAQADGSDLTAPYALPKAGHAAILARDAELAQQILDRLVALGARGRAIEADMDGIRAGIAGLRGDHAAALAAYRDVRNRFADLGLVLDVAFIALPAATVLGSDEPEVVGWLGEARGTFERLRAVPMIAVVDGFTEAVWAGRNDSKPESRPSDGSNGRAGVRSQAEASSSST